MVSVGGANILVSALPRNSDICPLCEITKGPACFAKKKKKGIGANHVRAKRHLNIFEIKAIIN